MPKMGNGLGEPDETKGGRSYVGWPVNGAASLLYAWYANSAATHVDGSNQPRLKYESGTTEALGVVRNEPICRRLLGFEYVLSEER